MNEKNVYEIAYKVIFDRFCDAAAEFDLSNKASVAKAEKASKALSDFEALAIEKGYGDIIKWEGGLGEHLLPQDKYLLCGHRP